MPSPETSRLSPEQYFSLLKEQERLRKRINSGNYNALQLQPENVKLAVITTQIKRHQDASISSHEQNFLDRNKAGGE